MFVFSCFHFFVWVAVFHKSSTTIKCVKIVTLVFIDQIVSLSVFSSIIKWYGLCFVFRFLLGMLTGGRWDGSINQLTEGMSSHNGSVTKSQNHRASRGAHAWVVGWGAGGGACDLGVLVFSQIQFLFSHILQTSVGWMLIRNKFEWNFREDGQRSTTAIF